MSRLTRARWAASVWGAVGATLIGVAVLGFGAPGWILVPVSWLTITLFTYAKTHVDSQAGPRRF